MTGSSYHVCGWGDMGRPMPRTMTRVSRTPMKIFQAIGQSFQIYSKSMDETTTTTTIYEIKI